MDEYKKIEVNFQSLKIHALYSILGNLQIIIKGMGSKVSSGLESKPPIVVWVWINFLSLPEL